MSISSSFFKRGSSGSSRLNAFATEIIAQFQGKSTAAVTVATLPAAASNVGRVLYCTNGKAGAASAVISDGTNWKVIDIGATAAAE